MSLLDLLIGKPLANTEERAEQIGPLQGIPIFGLDALSSAAYGPEAALTLLIPLGLLGLHYIIPVSAAIIALLLIVYFSYRQTIAAYPGGGGSYTVARYNLGARPSLLAAAALMTDYILTAAVGISAGVGALISAIPSLQPHTLSICLGILLLVTIVNLRGVREAGVAFMAPTYLFVGTLFIVIGGGLIRTLISGGHPSPVAPLPPPPPVTEAVTYWLLLKVFSSGCTALTGVEAVSNGVKAFREPAVKNAQRTLTIIIFLLAMLLAGISYLVKAYGIVATEPGQPGYQSILSMLTSAVFGKGFFYYLTSSSILLVLSLSANTAFADFPRLCRAIAQNNYLPHAFRFRGRRLVYSYGIVTLAILTALLLIAFRGITDRLIPLYAVGAFLAFTLSQAGMVVHWYKKRGAHCVVLIAKFAEGAWITLLFIPMLVMSFGFVRRHYHYVRVQTVCKERVQPANPEAPPLAIVPINRWSRIAKQAIEFATRLTPEIIAVHVNPGERSELLRATWERWVETAFTESGRRAPKLLILPSPYRFIILPILQYVLDLSEKHPHRRIVIVIPELVEGHWYEYFLHNQRGRFLEWTLHVRGNERIYTVSSPYYLGEHPDSGHEPKLAKHG